MLFSQGRLCEPIKENRFKFCIFFLCRIFVFCKLMFDHKFEWRIQIIFEIREFYTIGLDCCYSCVGQPGLRNAAFYGAVSRELRFCRCLNFVFLQFNKIGFVAEFTWSIKIFPRTIFINDYNVFVRSFILIIF